MYGWGGWFIHSLSSAEVWWGNNPKYRVNTGLTRLLIKVKGPIFINKGSDVYEYQKYRVWRKYRVESQISPHKRSLNTNTVRHYDRGPPPT